MKKVFVLTLTLALFYFAQSPALAQEQPTQQPTAEDEEKAKAEREKNAYRLLDQVIDEAQSLRLTENRVRVQISAADMLWERNQGRARSLFTMAGEGVAELGRNQQASSNRRNDVVNQERRAFQLRQELVLAAARHDAQLAYQLLATTKPATPATPQNNVVDARNPRPPMNSEENLEQLLLGRIAALDPRLAAQNAEQMMEKGQFPRSISEVITQLARQDAEAAAKLGEKTVKKIEAANVLTNNEAAVLAQSLLNAGMRLPATEPATGGVSAPSYAAPRGPVLDQSAYVELLSAVVDAALKVTLPPVTMTSPRPAPQQQPQRGRGPGAPTVVAPGRPGATAPTEAQLEQANARRLLAGLMMALPAIDQYLPAKAAAVRQKLTDLGVGNLATIGQGQPAFFPQGTPTADALMQAAATAPQPMQDRLYQQAAYRALEEGNADRARQIAADHLPEKSREILLERIQFRELARKADSARYEEIRQALNRLQTDNEKINLLIQLATDAQKTNPKLTVQLLDEAKQMTSRRATSYEQFEQQLRVAHAFASVDPARSFEVLDPGISQLNELLAAAAILNGFEINMFRDGEMTMQGGNGLTSTITRFGQELAVLARSDFERSDTLAGRFQLTEPRIMTRLSIVQELLNNRASQQRPGGIRPVGQNFGITRPE